MPLTRTNSKRWIAWCEYTDCGWSTGEWHREVATSALAAHLLDQHRTVLNPRTPRKDHNMGVKQATEELPEQEGGEKLSEYAGKLLVFDNARTATDDSQYGKRDTVHVDLWVFDPEHEQANEKTGWVAAGEVIVWFRTVGKQIMEALPDQLAGILTKGTDRNVNEWAVTPVPKSAKTLTAALDKWDPSF